MDEIRIVLSLIGIIGVLVLTYVGSKYLTKKVSFKSSKHIKIIERVPIGTDKSLIIVKIGEKYMLLSSSSQSVSKIQDLEESDIEITPEKPDDNSPPSFSKALTMVIAQKFGRKGGGNNEK